MYQSICVKSEEENDDDDDNDDSWDKDARTKLLDLYCPSLSSPRPEKADIVKLRYFAGLTLEETAAALGISTPTVHRHWRFARAWLEERLRGEPR